MIYKGNNIIVPQQKNLVAGDGISLNEQQNNIIISSQTSQEVIKSKMGNTNRLLTVSQDIYFDIQPGNFITNGIIGKKEYLQSDNILINLDLYNTYENLDIEFLVFTFGSIYVSYEKNGVTINKNFSYFKIPQSLRTYPFEMDNEYPLYKKLDVEYKDSSDLNTTDLVIQFYLNYHGTDKLINNKHYYTFVIDNIFISLHNLTNEILRNINVSINNSDIQALQYGLPGIE